MAMAAAHRQLEKQDLSASFHEPSAKRIRLNEEGSDAEQDEVFQPESGKSAEANAAGSQVLPTSENGEKDATYSTLSSKEGLNLDSKSPLSSSTVSAATNGNSVMLPSYGQSLPGLGFAPYPSLGPFNYSSQLLQTLSVNQAYNANNNQLCDNSEPGTPTTDAYTSVDLAPRLSLGGQQLHRTAQQPFPYLPSFGSPLPFNPTTTNNNNNNTSDAESHMIDSKVMPPGMVPAFTHFPFQNFSLISQTGLGGQGAFSPLTTTPYLLQKMAASVNCGGEPLHPPYASNGYLYSQYPYSSRPGMSHSTLGGTTQIYPPGTALPSTPYLSAGQQDGGNFVQSVRHDSIPSPTSHESGSVPTTPVSATPDVAGLSSAQPHSFPMSLDTRLQASAEANQLLCNFEAQRKSLNCGVMGQQQQQQTSAKSRRCNSTGSAPSSKRKNLKNRRATLSSLPMEPEQNIERVFIWNLDETIIIYLSLLNNSYASKFGKDPSTTMSLGLRAEGMIYKLAETHFFFNDLEGCDQVHVDDILADDNGQDLTDYKFESDGFHQSKANNNATLTSGAHARRGGADWMKKLAYRYRKIRETYSNSINNNEAVIGPAKYDNWMLLRREIDQLTDSWQTLAIKCLSIINRRTNCLSVVVTTSPLVLALAKSLIFNLAPLLPAQNFYSSMKIGNPACLEKIRNRFGKKCTYVVVGSGCDEEMACKQMSFPFWRVSVHNDLVNLHHALKLGHL